MARVEKQAHAEKQIKQVREEVVKEVKKNRKRPSALFSCSIIFFAVLAGFICWGIWMVSATGMVTIPVFTQLAYKTPQPVRIVEPGVPVEVVMDEVIKTDLLKRLQQSEGGLDDRSIDFSMNEASLTASLRSLLEVANAPQIDPSNLQVAIEPSGYELFLPIKDNPLETAAIIYFETKAEEGVMTIEIDKVKLGNLKVPNIIVTSMFKPMIQSQLGEINSQIASYVSLNEINLSSGGVQFTGVYSVEVLK